MPRAEYFKSEFEKIVGLHADGERATTVREGGRLLEELLKELVVEYLSRVPIRSRRAILDAEAEIGKGNKGVDEFQLGQLVGLYHTAKIFDAIGEVEGRATRAVVAVDLNLIRDLRNDCVHNGVVPEAADTEYVLSGLRTILGYFGIETVMQSRPVVRSIADMSNLLQERFVSAEAIEGTVAFYRRLAELAKDPSIDRFDLTYTVDHPPRITKSRPILEYWDLARRRVKNGEAQLRRIVTFNNPPKAAWILFNLIADHSNEFDENFILAYFEATRGGGREEVLLPNLSLFYSSGALAEGYAWIYSHDKEDQQNFICLSGKAVFPTMRHMYASWFKSCERLDLERATRLFRKYLGSPKDEAELRGIAAKYREAIAVDDDALESAIAFWQKALDRFPQA